MKTPDFQQLAMVETLSFGSWYNESLKRIRRKVPKQDENKVTFILGIALLGSVVRILLQSGMTTDAIVNFIKDADLTGTTPAKT